MSSLQLWEDKEAGVVVEWDKHSGYGVLWDRAEVHGQPGVVDYGGRKYGYASDEAALKAGFGKARASRRDKGLPDEIPPYEPYQPDESPAPRGP